MTSLPSSPALSWYDLFIVAFSGGKDSIACVLHLLELGVPASKIELWHHNIDGREAEGLMDWAVTPSYCRAFAASFGLAYYESWREGGFEREMKRDGSSASAPVHFETPEGVRTAGGNSKAMTVRMQFPQAGSITSGRWCSAVLKIDVMAIALNNQSRFLGKRTLVVTGERALESKARALYAEFELHRCNTLSRTVHTWRPVHKWTEAQVWAIMEAHNVNPHPAYRLGFGRVSCMGCIFGNSDQWASVRAIAPKRFMKMAVLEGRFGKTIDRHQTLAQKANAGTPYPLTSDMVLVGESQGQVYEVKNVRTTKWQLPAGAYHACGGPS